MTVDINGVDIPAILRTLSATRGTGTLIVTSPCGRAEVFISDGYVVGVTSDRYDGLGACLVAAGVTSEAALEGALSMQRRKKVKQPLGALLVDLDIAPREAVEDGIEAYVREVLADVLHWEGCDYRYMPNATGPGGQKLLPEGLRIDVLLISLLSQVPVGGVNDEPSRFETAAEGTPVPCETAAADRA